MKNLMRKFVPLALMGCVLVGCRAVVPVLAFGGTAATMGLAVAMIVDDGDGANADGQVRTIVGPDGKHTVVRKNGNTTTIMSDGKVATYHDHGDGNGVLVGSDGKHSTVHSHGEGTKVIVGPDGKHSTAHTTGSHTVMVGPDGSHTVVVTP